MKPRDRKTILLDLAAHATGNYMGAPGVAMLYYGKDKKAWAAPLSVSVVP